MEVVQQIFYSHCRLGSSSSAEDCAAPNCQYWSGDSDRSPAAEFLHAIPFLQQLHAFQHSRWELHLCALHNCTLSSDLFPAMRHTHDSLQLHIVLVLTASKKAHS